MILDYNEWNIIEEMEYEWYIGHSELYIFEGELL